jgi:hypothetical protein
MQQTAVKTLNEKFVTGIKAIEMKQQGNEDECMRITREEYPVVLVSA